MPSGSTVETSTGELAELMVGRKIRLDLDKAPAVHGQTMLAARGLSLIDRRGVRLLDGIDLELRAGEIVGIAGVSGNGQTELLQVLSGIRPPTTGQVEVCGRVIDPAHPIDPAEMRAPRPCPCPRGSLTAGTGCRFRGV